MVYRITVDGKGKYVEVPIGKYSLEADNLAREEIIRHFLEKEGAKEVRIESVKAKYELQAAPKLKICFEIDQDEACCEKRCLSFDPESEDYGLLGRMKLFDLTEDGAIQEWEEMLDLKARLSYGFLDELIENAVFNRLKGFRGKTGKPDKIGSYWTDDPAVVWLLRKETFQKVVQGWAIQDRKSFSGRIIGRKENGKSVRIDLPRDADAVWNPEGRTFKEVLDDWEAHE